MGHKKTRLWPTAPAVDPATDLGGNLRRSSQERQNQPGAEEGLTDTELRKSKIANFERWVVPSVQINKPAGIPPG